MVATPILLSSGNAGAAEPQQVQKGASALEPVLLPEDKARLEAQGSLLPAGTAQPAAQTGSPVQQQYQFGAGSDSPYGVNQATQPVSSQGSSQQFPLYELDEKDIVEMKEKAIKIKKAIEQDKPVKPKIRDVAAFPGKAPVIYLAHRYATVITLPYQVEEDDIALGDKTAFNVKVRGNILTIFPLKQFKQTNMVILSKTAGVHHYTLVEDSSSESADYHVNVKTSSSVPSASDALSRIAIGGEVPAPDTMQAQLFEGRDLVVHRGDGAPVLRKVVLSNPLYTVYLLDGKYVPSTGGADWYSHVSSRSTVVATKGGEISMRRVGDGKTITVR